MELQPLLGANVKAARRSRGLSQLRLAELAGLSEQMIGQVERAETWPSADTLEKLAAVLELDAIDFFAREIPLSRAPAHARLLQTLRTRLGHLDADDLGKVERAIRIALET